MKCKFIQEEHSLLDAGLISCEIHGNVTNDFCEACNYEKDRQGETMSEIDDADLDAIKRRLAGSSYRPHRWAPAGIAEERLTSAICVRCSKHAYSGKDFCDSEGLVKFWARLENRRDCK